MPAERGRPYRIFISGNCQAQFIFDALKFLFRGEPEISLGFRASYRSPRPGDDAASRCDLHILQVTNLEQDPWQDSVPAAARRIRIPVLQQPAIFHAFAPRVHADDPARGRPPHYLARGNNVLSDLALRFRQGERAQRLLDEYLNYSGAEIALAPRLWELNAEAMRRVGRNADFDLWRAIEPRLTHERFFWSVKHPTFSTLMMLLRPVLEALAIPCRSDRLEALAQRPEYFEPYHAPIHPRLAERLDLAWVNAETRFRFFHRYFTAADHARCYIIGAFARDFALNRAVQNARSKAADEATLALFRGNSRPFFTYGQAEFWHARVLDRQGRDDEAIPVYRQAISLLRHRLHPVPHRADVTLATAQSRLRQCQSRRGKGR